MGITSTDRELWPFLASREWKDTLHAIHMWTQVVGKIRLALTPIMNHWWNSTLFVTPRGLTTSMMPSGNDALQIDFDFVEHELVMIRGRSGRSTLPLGSMSVADFYRRVFEMLAELGLPDPGIVPVPVEVASAIPFQEDVQVRSYDGEMVERFHAALVSMQFVFDRFRADFLGKASPAHFFWGSFDLASSRFSGRRAPAYAGGTPPHVHIHVMHEAYSHELIAAGFWLGPDDAPQGEFYSYAMPAPAGLEAATIRPAAARWAAERGEFILPYEAVRTASDPDATLLSFLQSTYDAAADLGGWDRPLLEERVRCDCVRLPSLSGSSGRGRHRGESDAR
jgi:hypothetical protein